MKSSYGSEDPWFPHLHIGINYARITGGIITHVGIRASFLSGLIQLAFNTSPEYLKTALATTAAGLITYIGPWILGHRRNDHVYASHDGKAALAGVLIGVAGISFGQHYLKQHFGWAIAEEPTPTKQLPPLQLEESRKHTEQKAEDMNRRLRSVFSAKPITLTTAPYNAERSEVTPGVIIQQDRVTSLMHCRLIRTGI